MALVTLELVACSPSWLVPSLSSKHDVLVAVEKEWVFILAADGSHYCQGFG